MANFLPHLRLRTLLDSYMEELSEEFTIDILSRLPVKTIIHCKLVCKKWRNLVSDSSFVNLHLSRSPTGFIVHHKTHPYNIPNDPGTLKWVEIEDEVDHHHLHCDHLFSVDLNLVPVLQNNHMSPGGSVNGLICLWHCFREFNHTYICNPVTREYMVLQGQQRFQIDGYVAIACAFGVSSTGEYKLVQTVQRESSTLEVEVYTLGTGQWRSLSPVPVTYWLDTFHELYGLFLNNHCHWIVRDFEDNGEKKIVTFDFDKETFQFFPSPPPVKENHGQSLGILKGCLCKLDTYYSQVTIWVMKEYGIKNSWHKEMVITLEITIMKLPWTYNPIHLIADLKDGSILMVFESMLCVFDPRSQTIKATKTFLKPELSGWAYRPSFVRLQNFESEMVHMF